MEKQATLRDGKASCAAGWKSKLRCKMEKAWEMQQLWKAR
jgi:hypothetical protein